MQADALIGRIRASRTQVSRLRVENRKEIKFSGFCSVSLDWFRQQIDVVKETVKHELFGNNTAEQVRHVASFASRATVVQEPN